MRLGVGVQKISSWIVVFRGSPAKRCGLKKQPKNFFRKSKRIEKNGWVESPNGEGPPKQQKNKTRKGEKWATVGKPAF